jgi:malonyl-CoA decarboxylase
MAETVETRSSNLLSDLMSRIADAGRSLSSLVQGGPPPSVTQLCDALLTGRGEATGLAIAREILARYAALDANGKAAAFRDLSERFGVDPERLREAAARFEAEGAPAARALHVASEPRSQELIRRLNRAPGGTPALVDMRADLLRALREDPSLGGLDDDFKHLFASWFNRGFLELRRIDWDTPASILEKIIRYEAVHEINGWDDLRRRVAAPDRRLYAFFHPTMRDDPLIFVEVALTEEIPGAIGPILAEKRDALAAEEASVATFYSISNCQAGLRGVSFGHFLIKQVAEDLQREFAGLKTFVTLSPVPGLRSWALSEDGAAQLTETQRAALPMLDPADGSIDGAAAVEAQLALPGIAARYLVEARSPRGGALDPVARFHLGNGARLERIHAGADMSARGIGSSWGVMVDYLYDLRDVEKNHEAYANDGEIIASTAVRRLARAK